MKVRQFLANIIPAIRCSPRRKNSGLPLLSGLKLINSLASRRICGNTNQAFRNNKPLNRLPCEAEDLLKWKEMKKISLPKIQGDWSSVEIVSFKDSTLYTLKTYLLNPANALMVRATITVLKIKEIILCSNASLRILLEEISTSET